MADPATTDAMLAQVLGGIAKRLDDHDHRLRKLDRLRYTIEGAAASGAGTLAWMLAMRR